MNNLAWTLEDIKPVFVAVGLERVAWTLLENAHLASVDGCSTPHVEREQELADDVSAMAWAIARLGHNVQSRTILLGLTKLEARWFLERSISGRVVPEDDEPPVLKCDRCDALDFFCDYLGGDRRALILCEECVHNLYDWPVDADERCPTRLDG